MLLTLSLTGTTLNVMSLMGVVMLVGIAVSNSILIVEFTRRLRRTEWRSREAVALACRVRLRPVLMTSLATIIGLFPMALKLGDRQRSLRAAGARHYRRTVRFGGFDGVPRPRGVSAGAWGQARSAHHGGRMRAALGTWFLGSMLLAGQTTAPRVLTLKEAEQIALQNHPSIGVSRGSRESRG